MAARTCSAVLRVLLAATLLAPIHSAGIRGAFAADAAVREYLDEKTAATVTVTDSSFVFARERTDLAVNARDYLSLAAIEVNRVGQRAYFWSGYVWSTIDRRDRAPVFDPKATLVLLADGRPIPLTADGRSSREVGIGRAPTPVPARSATAVLFATDPETLAFVSQASELSVLLVREGASESLTLWRDARQPLVAFLRHLRHDSP